ncbi:RidA family protein [Streptomyces flaveolus]|uniref:RidA family protein n=1 Tax=Streptomyces flaveolus TaxID=67297 RepID=UPI003414FF6F
MSTVENLQALGLSLPQVATPLAAYVPAVQSGRYIHTSGQLPLIDGALPLTGKVGADVTPDQAKELARTCVLNALAAVKQIAENLDRIARVVKVVGYVASAPDFTGQPAVINGAVGKVKLCRYRPRHSGGGAFSHPQPVAAQAGRYSLSGERFPKAGVA